MLDEALSIVSIWTSVNSWLTPAVLFVVLNIVIGTIAFTSGLSNSSSSASKTQPPPSNNPHAPQPLPRSSSVLHHLRSLHLYRSEISPPSDSGFQHSVPVIPDPATIPLKHQNAVPETEYVGAGESVTRFEEEEQQVDELEGPTMEQVFSQIQRSTGVFGRSKSDGGHVPAPKKVRKRIIHKAASDISSVIGQFQSPMEFSTVPAVQEEEERVGGEVDGQAEDFINRFRQQLDLQRLDSIYGATS